MNCFLCGGSRYSRWHTCEPCAKVWHGLRQRAMIAVRCARLRGDLKNPKELACEDCAGPATEYDHRDYSKPLDVAPVCRTCNQKRGHALPALRVADKAAA